jgi:hypothetical protein
VRTVNEERYLIEEGEDRLVATAGTMADARLAARENIEPEGCRDSVLTIRRFDSDFELERASWNERDGVVAFQGSTVTRWLA